LTCTIGELDASGTPVTVTWKDSSDATVSNSDTSNYVLVEGTVDGSGEQNAVLTIKTAKLASYSAQASFTYKCSVQYSGSPASTEKDVVANVLTFGKILLLHLIYDQATFNSCIINFACLPHENFTFSNTLSIFYD